MNERYINNCARGVDKKDMICDALTHYKSIIVGAIVGMIVLTLVGCVVNVYQSKHPKKAETEEGEVEAPRGLGDVNALMKKIKDIQYLYYANDSMENYMDNSLLARSFMRYAHCRDISYKISIEENNKDDLIEVLQLYKAFLQSDEFYYKVSECVYGSVKPEYIYELIEFSWDENVGEECTSTIAKLTVVGPSDEYADHITECTKAYINECKAKILTKHNIESVIESSRTQYCEDFVQKMADMRSSVVERKDMISIAWSSFTPEQSQYREDYLNGTIKDISEYEPVYESEPITKVLTYREALSPIWTYAGFFVGIFAVIAFWCMLYAFSKVIHTDAELEYVYGARVYAIKGTDKKGFLGLINKIRYNSIHYFEESEVVQIINGVIKEKKLENVVMVSSASIKALESQDYEKISNVLYNPIMIQKLLVAKNVIIYEKLNSSKFNECVDVAKYLRANEINVIGVVR